jgi:hypothetical protein
MAPEITEEERAALIATRDFLAATPPPLPKNRAPGLDDTGGNPRFSMEYVTEEFSCGTSCCIGGYMRLSMLRGKFPPLDEPLILSAKEKDDVVAWVSLDDVLPPLLRGKTTKSRRSEALTDLFYPGDNIDDWRKITPAQAVQAIDNFLFDGRPRWRQIVGEF